MIADAVTPRIVRIWIATALNIEVRGVNLTVESMLWNAYTFSSLKYTVSTTIVTDQQNITYVIGHIFFLMFFLCLQQPCKWGDYVLFILKFTDWTLEDVIVILQLWLPTKCYELGS